LSRRTQGPLAQRPCALTPPPQPPRSAARVIIVSRKPYRTVAMASARAALLLRRQCLGAAAANPYLFSGHGLRYRKLEVILTTVTPPPVPSSRHASSVANLLFDTTLRCGSEAVALGQF